MVFKINLVQFNAFPNKETVTSALDQFGLTPDHALDAFRGFVCKADFTLSCGYQQNLAQELQQHLKSALSTYGLRSNYDRRYCPNLNENADVVLRKDGVERCIFIEIEFRPNVEKDLVKFQIGYNSGRLGVGVLVLAIDRAAINPGYKTMPEYSKFLKVIEELRPSYPLFVCGINGEQPTSLSTASKS
jgi:hypothetical protein